MIWKTILEEAGQENSIDRSLIEDGILPHDSIHESFASILSKRLSNNEIDNSRINDIISQAYQNNLSLTDALESDLQAILDRDFASKNYLYPFLFFNGFHGLELQRIAHHYYTTGDTLAASFLHERMVSICSMDIHPAARIGKRVVIDHGLGIVIGETADIGDDVFMYHNVTLGGTGTGGEKRHPTVEDNVLIGSGATVLGGITIGKGSAVAAGSVVTKPVPEGKLVAGYPARVIGDAKAFQRKATV